MTLIGTGYRSSVSCAILATVLLVSQGRTAQADPIRYEYGGVITSADPSTGVAAGARFEGTFTFDPNGPITEPLASVEGHIGYGVFTDPSGFILNVGGQQFFDSNGVGLAMDYGPHSSSTPIAQDPAMTTINILGSTDQLDVTLMLTNPSRSLFPLSSVPTALSLDEFPETQLLVVDRASHLGEAVFSGTIDTLNQVPVPEPGTVAWIVVVAGALAFRHLPKRIAAPPTARE